MIEKMEVYFSQRLTMLALSLQYTSNILFSLTIAKVID